MNTICPNFQAFPNNASNPSFQPNNFQPNIAGPSHNQPQQLNFQPNSTHPPQDDKRLTSLEKTLETLAKATTQSLQSNSNLQNLLTSYMQNTNQSIAKLEMQMSQLATFVSERERGTFPSQPISNPRNQNANPNQAHVVQDSNVAQLNAITTLRSGKQIDNQVANPNNLSKTSLDTSKTMNEFEQNMEPNIESNANQNSSSTRVDPSTEYRVPFPHRLRPKKHSDQMEKMLEIFKQVKVNIPLLDIVQQVPTYVKFLKDLCTQKRHTQEPKKSLLSRQFE